MHLTLIVNPFASSANARVRVELLKMLTANHRVDVLETTRSGHAIRLAHRAATAGTDVILGLGGDGTINEIANGVAGLGATIAPLPGGSTNVLARAVGYPNDPLEATKALLRALDDPQDGPTRIRAGAGKAGERLFLFHVGIGFDATVVDRVERRGPLKRYAGHALFAAVAADSWLKAVRQHQPWFSIRSADGRTVDDTRLAIALNTDPYTYLGRQPLTLAPEARLDRPLSVVTVDSLSAPSALRAGVKALLGDGGVPDMGSTSHWTDVHRFTVTGHRPFHYQLDGESFAEVEELTVDYLPDVVTIVVPVPTSGEETADDETAHDPEATG